MSKSNDVSINPDQTVEQAFSEILHTNLAATKEFEPVALAGKDPEGVHQMRVCLRRMRSALAVFRLAIPPNITRSYLKGMRKAAKTLDRARDLDVYIADNLSSQGEKPNRKMCKLAQKHRQGAYDQVRDFIESERYTRLCDEFRQWLASQEWRQNLSPKQREVLEGNVVPFASEVLESQRNHVLDDGRDIETLDSEALHQLRIDCKKLRYSAEFFAPLYGEPMQTFAEHLKNLQELLGTLHDTAVMSGLQEDLLKGTKNRNLRHFARALINKRGKQARAVRKALLARWNAFSQAQRPWAGTAVHSA